MVFKYISIILLFCNSHVWAFGDSYAMIPYLSQQLTVMRQSLGIANQTLKEVKNLQQGLQDPIAFLDQNLQSHVPEYADVKNLYKDVQKTQQSLQILHNTWEDYLDQSSQDKDYVKLRQVKTQHDRIDLKYLQQSQQALKRSYEKLKIYQNVSKQIKRKSQASKSGAQANKINAQAQSYLLEQGNDALVLQQEYIKLLQMQLHKQKAKDKQSSLAKKVETQKIIQGFKTLKAMGSRP